MKFFFADSLDVVDPSFDFTTEQRSVGRVRQRHDLYPHEIFAEAPYDGILVSKAIVDGLGSAISGKYSMAQRHRLLQVGVREFFRLDERERDEPLLTMGDCGAFTYFREERPPYTVDEVIEFYDRCGFDYGVSVDHVILSYRPAAPLLLPGIEDPDPDVESDRRRQQITLEYAADFLAARARRGSRFIPVGVAQGWSPASYRYAVEQLQQIGYDHLAVGGLVPLKTPEILEVLAAVQPALRPGVKVHLFGVTRVNHVEAFARYGVTSFDSTSPLRQAFKDDKDNYYTPTGTYTAVRVPQVDKNPDLKDWIRDGKVNQADAVRLERECLDALARFDREPPAAEVEEVVDLLRAYEKLHDGRTDRSEIYRKILQDKPWKQCPCEICRALGIHVILFRGAERNRRRGFHNLYVFERRLRGEGPLKPRTDGRAGRPAAGAGRGSNRPNEANGRDDANGRDKANGRNEANGRKQKLAAPTRIPRRAGAAAERAPSVPVTPSDSPMSDRILFRVPAIEIKQGPNRTLYSFAVDGKKLPDFTTVSRIRREGDGGLFGYQRPEVLSHIAEIRRYLESENPMIPNALVVAFDARVRFEPFEDSAFETDYSRAGILVIPVDKSASDHEKPGWIVDGQQRAAAIREAGVSRFPVCVTGFIASDDQEQREQFILVNSTKPLPKGLIYELLPQTESALPALLQRRRFPAHLLTHLNADTDSPLRGLIETATNSAGVIKDNSILKMLENSLSDGVLYRIGCGEMSAPHDAAVAKTHAPAANGAGGEEAAEVTAAMLRVVKDFWSAVRDVFKEAWALPPRKSRLMHGAGVISLGFLMDAISDRYRRKGRPSVGDFRENLSPLAPVCRWTSGYWDFGPGAQRKWNEVQNTSKDIQLLSNHLLIQYRTLVWNRTHETRAAAGAAGRG